MKRSIFLLIFSVAINSAFLVAQNQLVDSLRTSLAKTKLASERQNLHMKLADLFTAEEENDSAIYHLEIIVNAKEYFISDLELAEAYRNLGLLYQYKSQFKKANEFSFKGLSIKERINAPPEAMASSHTNIALSYQELGQFEKAIEHQKISLDFSVQANDSSRIGERYNMIGDFIFNCRSMIPH